jgi:MerR family transcriptional regulator, light-induced transcriptional regulator
LGVSEASVKRWADGGLLPALKTAGGHRRFRPEDIAAFRRGKLGRRATMGMEQENATTRRDAVNATHDLAPPDLKSDDSMFTLLLGGHEEEASAMLVSLYLRRYTIGQIADATLCPAMRKVGDLWHRGELSVVEEHLATRTALTALQALDAALSFREWGIRFAICCSVEDDFHELPIYLAALVLEAQGWSVINLGMSTPFYALAEAVERFNPRVVCVASTVFNQPDRAGREYAEFRAAALSAGSAIVLGGAGFSSEHVRRRFPADLYADNFRQLEQFAPTLYVSEARELS